VGEKEKGVGWEKIEKKLGKTTYDIARPDYHRSEGGAFQGGEEVRSNKKRKEKEFVKKKGHAKIEQRAGRGGGKLIKKGGKVSEEDV